MKIVIGYPPVKTKGGGTPLLQQNRQYQEFHNPTFLYPVIMSTAATLLRDLGHKVYWLDGIARGMSQEQYIDACKQINPDLIAFESKSPAVKSHWDFVRKIKTSLPSVKVVMLGEHGTSFPEESFENSPVDYVFAGGHFDFGLKYLTTALENKEKIPEGFFYREGKKVIGSKKFIFKEHLDTLPFPDRVLTRCFEDYQAEFNIRGRPFAYTMSGRDCWYGKCTFCSWDSIMFPKGSFRSRSPENTLAEVDMLINKFGVREIFDDAGTITIGSWLDKFCDLLIDGKYYKKIDYSSNMRFGYRDQKNYDKMKKAGFRLLKFGLESANQKTLEMLDKDVDVTKIEQECRDIKKAGLTVHLTMMVGYPWETKEDALNTLRLAKNLMHKGYADVLQSTVVMPYPGTALWRQAIEHKWFRPEFDHTNYDNYDMTMPVMKTPDMNPKEVMAICDNIYKDIFLKPKYIYQHLKKIRTVDDIKYTLRGVKAVMGHVKDFSRTPQI